jgi:hypothetical protein
LDLADLPRLRLFGDSSDCELKEFAANEGIVDRIEWAPNHGLDGREWDALVTVGTDKASNAIAIGGVERSSAAQPPA